MLAFEFWLVRICQESDERIFESVDGRLDRRRQRALITDAPVRILHLEEIAQYLLELGLANFLVEHNRDTGRNGGQRLQIQLEDEDALSFFTVAAGAG